MKSTTGFAVAALSCAVLSFAWSSSALAQRGDDGASGDLALTITLMPEGAESPDIVTRDIALPVNPDGDSIPSAQGETQSAQGVQNANEAQADGRAFGEAAAAAAEANREELGRASVPNLEDLRPDDLPAPPDTPPARP